MDLKKYKSKGLTGLLNLGNTCFLNSCVQILNNTPELYFFLESNKFSNVLKSNDDSVLLLEYNELRNTMFNTNGTVSPKRFLHYIQDVSIKKNRDIFSGFNQNDMAEFLLFLIDCMHNSLSRPIHSTISGVPVNNLDKKAIICFKFLQNVYKKEYSEIMHMFYGISVCEIRSLSGENYSYRPEHYFMIDLPIENDDTLYDCLERYIGDELMDGDNMYYNENKKQKEPVYKRITFWSFPDILIICLKRFSFDGSEKNHKQIDFPIYDLDLSKFSSGYNKSGCIYDLYGICNHMGTLNGGHYTCYVKKNDNWLDINDESICKMEEKKLISKMSYCLFYRKKNLNII